MPNLANDNTCTGCLACVDTCSKGALSSCYNEEGHLFYKINSSLCVECGLCEKKCPVVSGYNYGENKFKDSKPFAAWSKDDELRAKSTSGGVFASLAKYIIQQGGVAIGACMRHNVVSHIAIERIDDISMLQGSKYTQSNTEGIYRNVRNCLQAGRTVLFSGLGCQVAGLLSYLGNKPYSGNLYTVDLICGGVPSYFIIDRFLDHNTTIKEIVGYRNKEEYEFSVIDNEGVKRVIPLSERPFPLCGFYTELTNRYSCYDCKFSFAHRKADLTIGDLWGDKRYSKYHKDGVSLVIIHSNKGKEVLRQSEIILRDVNWEDVLPNNSRIAYGKNILGRTRARKRLSIAFKEDSYQSILDDYANDASVKRPWSIAKKLYRFILVKRNHIIIRRHIKSILKL